MTIDVNAAIALKTAIWRKDIVRYVRENFQTEPDGWQHRVLIDFANPATRRLAMKACKNPGKTAVLSWCAWWFLTCYPDPKVIATSINGPNLSDGLWSEMAKWQQKSSYLMEFFVWTKTQIFHKGYPATWFMAARMWSKSADATQQADTLAGKHGDYILFILDEVGGIPQAVMAAADASLGSGKVSKILMAGNPTQLDGPLYRACTKDRTMWSLHEVTGDPDDPMRAPRVDIEWAREQIRSYGRDDPWVKANVLGQFPPSSINSLLGPDDCAAAMRRNYRGEEFLSTQRRMGVDAAGYGDDPWVLFPRQGLVAYKPVIMRDPSGPEVAARIAHGVLKWGGDVQVIFDDTGGWASSAQDFSRQAGHVVIPINFAGKATDPRYLNKRAEMYFEMAKWVKNGGALPNDPEITEELTVTTYSLREGKLLLEPKDRVKERLKRSPNKADALALTFALPDMPIDDLTRYFPGVAARRGNHAVTDYDPHQAFDQGKVGRAQTDYNPFA